MCSYCCQLFSYSESVKEAYPYAKEKQIRTQIGNKLRNSIATHKRTLDEPLAEPLAD